MNIRTLETLLHTRFKKIAKPLVVAISALFIVSMMSAFAAQQATAATTVLDISSGSWINQAHTNVEPITTYNIPNTQGTRSASGIPDLDNCYLPASIFRGYSRWDANGGYFNLQSYPYLSFDIWVDKVMQIEVGLVDTSNGGWVGGYNTLIADTYHNGQANTPPYNNLYGAGTVKSSDGYWLLMVGPSDGSTTHYTIDLRTLGCNLGHIGQIIFDFTSNHQSDIHWKIHNITLSTNGVSSPQPTASPTPAPTATPTQAPTPTPTATPTPKPTVTTPTPVPTAPPAPTPKPTTPATPQPTPIVTPSPTPSIGGPAATISPTPQPTQANPTVNPIQHYVFNYSWWWNVFSWTRYSVGFFSFFHF